MNICDICKKNNATISIQRFINGKLQVLNLCADCAAKEQADIKLLAGDINMEEILDNIKKITEKLNLQSFIPNTQNIKKESIENFLTCPKCHWTIEKIDKNHGFLGCDECYKTFRDVVTEAIENIHRCKIHTGKRPANISLDDSEEVINEKIQKLEEDLKVVIAEEKYEQAALIRDEINILKNHKGEKPNE